MKALTRTKPLTASAPLGRRSDRRGRLHNSDARIGRQNALRRDARSDTGAAMVEFAITSIILAVMLFAIIEGGLAFRAKLSLSNSSDEAARRGAVAGDDPFADYEILQQVLRHSSTDGAITAVVIFRANDIDGKPAEQCNTASSTTHQCNLYLPEDFARPRSDFGTCTTAATALDGGWCPTDRNTELRSGDLLGVQVTGRFDSPSGALGHIDLTDVAVLPMESKGL